MSTVEPIRVTVDELGFFCTRCKRRATWSRTAPGSSAGPGNGAPADGCSPGESRL